MGGQQNKFKSVLYGSADTWNDMAIIVEKVHLFKNIFFVKSNVRHWFNFLAPFLGG